MKKYRNYSNRHYIQKNKKKDWKPEIENDGFIRKVDTCCCKETLNRDCSYEEYIIAKCGRCDY